MPAPSRPKVKHRPRTKGPVGEVITRKVALGWVDLARSLQDDARERFGAQAEHRIQVVSPGCYREV